MKMTPADTFGMEDDLEIFHRVWEVIMSRTENELIHPGHIVLREPGSSIQYRDCNGVVLLGDGIAGLTHYSMHAALPEAYLPQLLDELTPEDGLSAVVIGGDPTHFARIMRFLTDRRIPIVGHYLDSWIEFDYDIPVTDEMVRYLQSKRDDVKTLGIIPQTKEVVMYCPRVGNQVLSPSQ